MQILKPAKVTTTIKHKETGEIYTDRRRVESQGNRGKRHPKRCPCPHASA